MDEAEVAMAVHGLLDAMGENPERDGLKDTPKRVARAYRELFAGYGQDPKKVLGTVFEVESYDEMIASTNIDFYSMCEHHMLPFIGTATVAYIPGEDGRVVGLSKLSRLVEVFARRLQIQERMTKQIADAITEALQPRGVGVVVRARHLCMAARGVGKQNSDMVTSAVSGLMKTDAKARDEFLRIAGL